MKDCENRILKGKQFRGIIKHWARYVDNILIVWSATGRQVDLFLKEKNTIHKDTKFRVEKGNKTINYLDLTLTVNSENLQKTNLHGYHYPNGLFTPSLAQNGSHGKLLSRSHDYSE